MLLLLALLCMQVVHVGDALSQDAAVPGGSAGIIVDLFAQGQLLPQLTQVNGGSAREAAGRGSRTEGLMTNCVKSGLCL